MDNLTDLDLSSNLIEGQLPVLNLPKLKKLNLNRNIIKNIQSLATSEIPSITTLDIGYNRI